MKKTLARVIAIFFGIILALLVLEFSLRLIPEAAWKGLISKTPIRYILYQADTKIGWVHIPNARANLQRGGEYNVDIQINSHGLRDREHSYDKPANTFRILVLGDSFADALQVPLAHAFPVKLESCLSERLNSAFEVINAGTSAYGPGDQLLFFANEGVRYQPDLVLVAVYTANDVNDLVRAADDNMIQSFGGYKFYLEDGQLKKKWIEWAEPDYQISLLERMARRYSNLYYVFKAPDSRVRREISKRLDEWWPERLSQQSKEEVSDSSGYRQDAYLAIYIRGFPDNPIISPYIGELWELFRAIFLKLQVEVEAQDAQLAAVIIPRAAQVHEPMYEEFVLEALKRFPSLGESNWAAWDINAPNGAMGRFFEDNRIPALDLLPGFQTYAKTHDKFLYFQQDVHFNTTGHQVTANLVCDWLIAAGLVPSEK